MFNSSNILQKWPTLKHLPWPEPLVDSEEHRRWRREYKSWKDLKCSQGKGYFCREHAKWISCSEVEQKLAVSQAEEGETYCPSSHYSMDETSHDPLKPDEDLPAKPEDQYDDDISRMFDRVNLDDQHEEEEEEATDSHYGLERSRYPQQQLPAGGEVTYGGDQGLNDDPYRAADPLAGSTGHYAGSPMDDRGVDQAWRNRGTCSTQLSPIPSFETCQTHQTPRNNETEYVTPPQHGVHHAEGDDLSGHPEGDDTSGYPENTVPLDSGLDRHAQPASNSRSRWAPDYTSEDYTTAQQHLDQGQYADHYEDHSGYAPFYSGTDQTGYTDTLTGDDGPTSHVGPLVESEDLFYEGYYGETYPYPTSHQQHDASKGHKKSSRTNKGRKGKEKSHA